MEVEESAPEALKQATRLYESIEYADGGVWIQRMLDAAGTTKVSEEIGRRQGTVEPVSSARLMELLEELDAYRSDMLALHAKLRHHRVSHGCVPSHASRDLEAGWHLPRVQPYVGVQPHGMAGRRGPGGHFTRRTSLSTCRSWPDPGGKTWSWQY